MMDPSGDAKLQTMASAVPLLLLDRVQTMLLPPSLLLLLPLLLLLLPQGCG
jgi:hypothetical protein